MKHPLAMIVLAVAIAAATSTAQAISRYNSLELSCQRVHDIINASGAAIMRYPSARQPDLTRYDRYVAHGGYCAWGEFAQLTTIPTADTSNCRVLRCFQKSYFFDD